MARPTTADADQPHEFWIRPRWYAGNFRVAFVLTVLCVGLVAGAQAYPEVRIGDRFWFAYAGMVAIVIGGWAYGIWCYRRCPRVLIEDDDVFIVPPGVALPELATAESLAATEGAQTVALYLDDGVELEWRKVARVPFVACFRLTLYTANDDVSLDLRGAATRGTRRRIEAWIQDRSDRKTSPRRRRT